MKKNKLEIIPESKGIIEQLTQGRALTQQQEHILRALLPQWVVEKENVGTAMMQTAQEFLIMLENILIDEEGWDEKDIIKLEKQIKKVLPVLHNMEINRNLSILSSHDMAKVGDIAKRRYDRLDKTDKAMFLGVGKKIKQLGKGK